MVIDFKKEALNRQEKRTRKLSLLLFLKILLIIYIYTYINLIKKSQPNAFSAIDAYVIGSGICLN